MYDMSGVYRNGAVDQNERKSCSTLYGFNLTKKLLGIGDRQALRLIRNAWTRGKQRDQLPLAWQKQYLDYNTSLTITGRTILRVYAGYLFTFSAQGLLITLRPLPARFYKKRFYDGKTRVRHARKYTRFNAEMPDAGSGDLLLPCLSC